MEEIYMNSLDMSGGNEERGSRERELGGSGRSQLDQQQRGRTRNRRPWSSSCCLLIRHLCFLLPSQVHLVFPMHPEMRPCSKSGTHRIQQSLEEKAVLKRLWLYGTGQQPFYPWQGCDAQPKHAAVFTIRAGDRGNTPSTFLMFPRFLTRDNQAISAIASLAYWRPAISSLIYPAHALSCLSLILLLGGVNVEIHRIHFLPLTISNLTAETEE
ncbi:uncharacterized protein LOC131913246 [Peromyscus eremicus]|uniref:uncharacterized protein LOC131913246 n=1 Tax=Peromyscus eremicus TaxID=42410 RepID=UPI0027DC7363|nr:uncharacterized protein LOC131913246 [Peromyscus eremicus]